MRHANKRMTYTVLAAIGGLLLTLVSPCLFTAIYEGLLQVLGGAYDDFPLDVILVGMLVVAPTVLITSILVTVEVWRKTTKLQVGMCEQCGYDLRGTPRTSGATCPECGQTIGVDLEQPLEQSEK